MTKKIARRQLLALTASGAALHMTGAAQAQATYPNRAVKLVVPSSAGGGTDVLARTLGERLRERLGQPIVIDNKPGANGIIGAEAVAHAPPDGYTLLISANNAMSANVSLYKKLSYDPVRDFTPIALLISSPLVLIVNSALPVRTLAEFIELARSKPGEFYFGSGASHSQIAGHMFCAMAGIKATDVPYKGPVPAITDVATGQIQFTFETLSGTRALRASGAVRALAVTSQRTSVLAADLPTVAQTLPGFEYNAWIGVFAPAGLPVDVRDKLQAAIQGILRTPDVQQRLTTLGFEVDPRGSEELAILLRSDIPRLRKVIRDAGLSAE
jgi:tripartite-type tricarboxylate transporter receptor subunit TctC